MEQNPNSEPIKPYLFDQDNRGLDEPPTGYSDGSGMTREQLGFLAGTYVFLRELFNMDAITSAHNALNRTQGKPPSGI